METKITGIKEDLRKFIISNYMLDSGDAKLSDDDSFLDEGIIDSIGVIELASHLQRTYGIKIRVPEIVPSNFDTINNLERYITKKLQENT